MRIDEGSRSNFSTNAREHELVLIDRRAKDFDTVFAVTSEALKQPEPIPIPGTPLLVQCIQYFPNSNIVAAKAESSSPADKGIAVEKNLTLKPAAISYDDNKPNIVSAYVKIFADEHPVGTWLVSNLLEINNVKQIVRWKEQEWELALRFQRSYYPFEIELTDFKHNRYPGTDIPFNFSSEVQIYHQHQNLNQKALIYMNHPLRYEGLTFYQSGLDNNDTTTILQVVRNPGWLLPYISVLLMGLGMCLQFGLHFYKFLKKRKTQVAKALN